MSIVISILIATILAIYTSKIITQPIRKIKSSLRRMLADVAREINILRAG
ncbi:MAG: hypothetical protein ACLBM1_14920 [Cuspidothrix sp.]